MADKTKDTQISAVLEDPETRLVVYFQRVKNEDGEFELVLKYTATFAQKSSDGSKVAPAVLNGQTADAGLSTAFDAAINAAIAAKGF